MPEKVTILSLIEAIKTWESFDEDFIKDRLGVISSASKEKKKLAFEERKLELEPQVEKEKEQRKLQAEKEKEQRKIEAEKEKEEKRIALEERKLELEAGIEEKKLMLEAVFTMPFGIKPDLQMPLSFLLSFCTHLQP